MNFNNLFDKINMLKMGCIKKTRIIIDVETLEIYKGTQDVAKKIKCYQTEVANSISKNIR